MTSFSQTMQDKLFGSRRKAYITLSLSTSAVIGIVLFLKYNSKSSKLRLLQKYKPLYEDAVDERKAEHLTNDGPVFVKSSLNEKYLRKIEILYINRAFLASLGVQPSSQCIFDLISNVREPSVFGASYYSGSTPQLRGFAAYVGTMGDGRVVSCGQVTDEQHRVWEVQLKGFGQTVIAKDMFKHKDGKLSMAEYEKEIKCWTLLKELDIPSFEILGAVALNGKVRRRKRRNDKPPKLSCRVHIKNLILNLAFATQGQSNGRSDSLCALLVQGRPL